MFIRKNKKPQASNTYEYIRQLPTVYKRKIKTGEWLYTNEWVFIPLKRNK
jgi:hypothetical protein